jgi:hypothetical protein
MLISFHPQPGIPLTASQRFSPTRRDGAGATALTSFAPSIPSPVLSAGLFPPIDHSTFPADSFFDI